MKITFWYGVSIVITLLAAVYGSSDLMNRFLGLASFWFIGIVLAGMKWGLVKVFGKTSDLLKDTAWIASILAIIVIISEIHLFRVMI